LELNHCQIKDLGSEKLQPIETLKTICFEMCNENVFKAFANQKSFLKIRNNNWSHNGFPHEIFNEICRNCKKLNHLVLEGGGTESYFDCDEFPYKITKLEISVIKSHRYGGIRTQKINLLESQKGSLKELTIHHLPCGFDGGQVLKYIIEEMKLETFYYRKIPLILNGQKQNVKEFKAYKGLIISAYEMIRQFPCKYLTSHVVLNLEIISSFYSDH